MNPQAHQNALSPAHSLRYSFASGGTSHTFRLYFKRLSERFRLRMDTVSTIRKTYAPQWTPSVHVHNRTLRSWS